MRLSIVRAPMRRRFDLSLEKAISIGFKSGLQGGRKRNLPHILEYPCRFLTFVYAQVVENDDGGHATCTSVALSLGLPDFDTPCS